MIEVPAGFEPLFRTLEGPDGTLKVAPPVVTNQQSAGGALGGDPRGGVA
jgi:hypothetical protein